MPIQCSYCDLEYPKCDFKAHEQACGSRTEDCDKCQQKVMLCDMIRHELSGCHRHATNQQQRQPQARQRQSVKRGSVPRRVVDQIMYPHTSSQDPPPMPVLPKVTNKQAAYNQSKRSTVTSRQDPFDSHFQRLETTNMQATHNNQPPHRAATNNRRPAKARNPIIYPSNSNSSNSNHTNSTTSPAAVHRAVSPANHNPDVDFSDITSKFRARRCKFENKRYFCQ